MKTDQEIYSELVNKLIKSTPQDWGEIKIKVQASESGWETVAWYFDTRIKAWTSYASKLPFFEMHNWLKELKKFTNAHNFVSWNTFELMIDEKGKFSIDYSWDQEYQNEIDGVV
jgi:hypothetical protein